MTHWEILPSSSEVEHLTVNQNVAGSIPAGGANVDGSSIGRAPDCGSGGCEFDSHLSTQKKSKKLHFCLDICLRI